MAELKENFKNPLFVVIYTFMEIFLLGVIISLISAAVLKKKSNAGKVAAAN